MPQLQVFRLLNRLETLVLKSNYNMGSVATVNYVATVCLLVSVVLSLADVTVASYSLM